jgi:hypothetical protein
MQSIFWFVSLVRNNPGCSCEELPDLPHSQSSVYYVSADDYSTGKNADKEFDHRMSIVKSANLELLQQFRIMMPEKSNILLLAELYRRKVSNKPDMKSDDIIAFFNE